MHARTCAISSWMSNGFGSTRNGVPFIRSLITPGDAELEHGFDAVAGGLDLIPFTVEHLRDEALDRRIVLNYKNRAILRLLITHLGFQTQPQQEALPRLREHYNNQMQAYGSDRVRT